jgi:hypothetical protein
MIDVGGNGRGLSLTVDWVDGIMRDRVVSELLGRDRVNLGIVGLGRNTQVGELIWQ